MPNESTELAQVAKRFRWESAHRLPRHEGACRHLHGHSYAMTVALEGPVDETGLVIDFQVIKDLVKPLTESWDHATLVAEYDTDLVAAVRALNSRYVILPADSTAENLAGLVADHIEEQGGDLLKARRMTRLRVRVEETETCFAEVSRAIGRPHSST